MAGGKYYDESGDFDAAAEDFGGDQHGVSTGAKLNGQEVDGYGDPVGKSRFGQKRGEDGKSSWGLLKKGEKDASQDPNRSGRGGDKGSTLGQKENNVSSENGLGGDSKFKNAVKGVNALKSGRMSKAKGHFKKSGPIIAILVGMLGFGGASFFGQMAMPFSLVSQLQEKFDSISISQNMRSRRFLKWQTAKESGKVKDCIKAHYFKADEFKISDKQKAKLAKSNITVEEDADGVTVLKHTGADGTTKTIVADKSLATNGRVSFEDAFENDMEFRTGYTEGSRTWRGSVGAWFDSSMEKLLKKLGVYRGVWSDFKSGKVDEEKMGEMRKTMTDTADSDSAGGKVKNTEFETEEYETKNERGETVKQEKTKIVEGKGADTSLSRDDIKMEGGKVKDASGVKTKLVKAGKVAAAASAAGGVFGTAANLYCGVADAVGAITAIVAAYQALQIVKTASAMLEGIQKAQAGDGDGAPLHELMNSLTTSDENTYEEIKSVKRTGGGPESEDADVEVTDSESTTRSRSAMESEGIASLYSGTLANSNDPSVKSFIPGSFTKNMWGGLSSVIDGFSASAKSFQSCTIARLSAAAVSAAADIVSTILCVASLGLGCVIDKIIDEGAGIAISIGISLLVATIVSFAIPHVAKVLTRKIATEVVGEDLGNALVSGTNMYMSKNHQNSGGSLIGQDDYAAYLQQRDIVIAENARYERETRSPFDITSKYTFLGSLANQMIPIASSATSLTKITSSMGTLLQNSVLSLSPKSSAVSAGMEAEEAIKNTEKNCPELYEIHAVGDAFCNPYIGTDTSTMSIQPAEVVNSAVVNDSLEDVTGDEGAPKIKENSDLAKYIIYCGQRESQFGTPDQNIASDVDGGSTGSTTGDAVLGAVPIVGDVLDIISNSDKLANLGYITGESCVTGNESSALEWKDAKYYQRFIEDQRLAEAEGVIEESAVTEFVSSYYEKHPLDNSFEGVIARYSGMSKEKVIATLSLMELSEWIAEYKPTTLLPYPSTGDDEKAIEVQVEDNIGFEMVASIYMDDMFKHKRETQYITA